ncbi:MAG TPA: adenylate/guanylate cyclase domain-containing protein [Acidiferrobacterales bacterium]|nr:adenylate/guanylate cyclase domain-containing protein [Acidiferrobacterales bacterium]
MQAFLLFKEGDQARQVECKEVMIIGREVNSDIVLDDARVSRRHAMLYRMQDGSIYIVDEDSSNGSYVNAVRIRLPTRLNDGDQISIGSMNMQFRQPSAKAAASQPRDLRATTIIVQESIELIRIAILVADIRGFTSLSESIPVRDLTELMNQWFREATQCIKQRRGTIDKFMGDCVYARWDANADPGGSLLNALGAACALDRITRHLNETRPNLPQQLKIGVGINIGNAALGTEQGRTAIGDAVNLTFRLQEKTKTLGRAILLNRDAYLNLPSDLWQGREQTISVAGKTQPLDVWGITFEEAEALLQAREQR